MGSAAAAVGPASCAAPKFSSSTWPWGPADQLELVLDMLRHGTGRGGVPMAHELRDVLPVPAERVM